MVEVQLGNFNWKELLLCSRVKEDSALTNSVGAECTTETCSIYLLVKQLIGWISDQLQVASH